MISELNNLNLFASAALIGLLSGGHCMGMCGGIASAMSLSQPVMGEGARTLVAPIITFNAGRIATYTFAGGAVGAIAQQLTYLNPMIGMAFRTVAGLLLIAMGLYLARWWLGLTRLEAVGQYWWRFIQPLTRHFSPTGGSRQTLMLGALWGWLPCGLVYSTLAFAASSGQWYKSALVMLCFGLGTLPALLLTGVLAQSLSHVLQSKHFRFATALMLIAFGLWTIVGNGLWQQHTGGGTHGQHGHQQMMMSVPTTQTRLTIPLATVNEHSISGRGQ